MLRTAAITDIRDGRVGREYALPAFAAAAERGFAIECDVQLTADGAVVVFHDATLDRLTTATRGGGLPRHW